MSGNRKGHLKPLNDLRSCHGVASLQNTILRALSILRYAPTYGHKELIIIYSSLGSCDPCDIQNTIDDCNKCNLKVSIVCLVAEVYICRRISENTGGRFSVAVDAAHLVGIMSKHAIPPPHVFNQTKMVADLVYMGFPTKRFESHGNYVFEGKSFKINSYSYVCPRCVARTNDIPATCIICSLQLNSSSHIARSHHHLFPMRNFIEERGGNTMMVAKTRCFGCNEMITITSLRLQCSGCEFVYCVECDVFMHDLLHSCPGCHM